MSSDAGSRLDAPSVAVDGSAGRPDDPVPFGVTARKVLQQSTDRRGEVPPREFALGEQFPLLGDPRRVVATAQRDAHAVVGDRLVIADSHAPGGPDVRAALSELYRAAARRYVAARIDSFADAVGVSPPEVELFDAPTRLVDCRPEPPVGVNWRAVMAPREVLDHALVHALVHLAGDAGAASSRDTGGAVDHGPAFVRAVDSHRPPFDYTEWIGPMGIAMRLPP